MLFQKFSFSAIVAGLFLLSGAANANIIINTDQSASGSLGTIDFVNGGPALTVQGTADSGALLDFIGLENLSTFGGGQARVEGSDGLFTAMTLQFANGNLFARMVFNLDAEADGSLTVTAYDQFLNPYIQVLGLDGSGQNFINVQASGIHFISRVQFSSNVDLTDIAQVRVDNIPDTGIIIDGNNVVPEPASFAMLGAGLAAVVLLRRRKA